MSILIRFLMLNSFFALASSIQAHSSTTVPHEFLDELVKRYLEAEQAMVGNDLESAQKKGRSISRLFNLDTGEKAHDAFPELRRYAHRLSKAPDLERARYDFRHVSVMLKHVLTSLGYLYESGLRVYRCDVALDGVGGVWLEPGKEPISPYCDEYDQCDVTELERPFPFLKKNK